MFDSITTDMGSRFLLAIGAVGLGLIILVAILMLLRRKNSALFVRGGKSREPRLMVLDAAAIDARRRLVLIRRDNIEHLIMIGGPTDIVIESGIGNTRRAAPETASIAETAQPPLRQKMEPAEKVMAQATQSAPVQSAPIQSAPILSAPVMPEPVRAEPVRIETAQNAPEPEIEASLNELFANPTRSMPVQRQPVPMAAPLAQTMPEPQDMLEPEPVAVISPSPVRPLAEAGQRAVQPAQAPMPTMAAPSVPLQASPLAPSPVLQRPNVLQPQPITSPFGAPQSLEPERQPQPTYAPTPAPTPAPMSTSAEDILDAARNRVLQAQNAAPSGRIEPDFGTRPDLTRDLSAPSVPGQTGIPQRRDDLAAEFERILEAEMNSNGLDFDDGSMAVQPDTRGPSLEGPGRSNHPPITGSTGSSDLEKEMARLLGEMSVKRGS